MATWLRWLRRGAPKRGAAGRGPASATTAATTFAVRSGGAEIFRSQSIPEDATLARGWDSYVPLPNGTPFQMLQVYRFLRDAIPDISDAIWTWTRLCQTGYDIEFVDCSSEPAKRRALKLVHALDLRVNSGDRGMDGLVDILLNSLFTYGAAAVEIVLSQSRETIWDVIPVDVWTIRFKREQGRLQAYQLHEGEATPLPMERFVYIGLDRAGTNPYGQSILRTVPFAVKVQQRLLEDMAKATHNTGWSKLHVKYTPDERQRGESAEAHAARINSEFEQLRKALSKLDTDQNLVTHDNVSMDVLRGEQRSQVFYENQKAVEEQVITGLHLMPILLGRNYGTTETYGTAQFEIVNRHVEAVNRNIKRLLERLYNFELALMWGEAQARVHMRGNRTVDVLKEATARGKDIQNVLALREAGLIDTEAALRQLRLNP